MNCYPTIDCPYKEDIEALSEEQVAERYDDYLQDTGVDADIHWQEHRLWVETDTPLMRETWIPSAPRSPCSPPTIRTCPRWLRPHWPRGH